MVLPPNFEFRRSQTGSSHRDAASRSAAPEPSEQATRLLGDHERVDSRRGELGEAISISPGHQEFFVASPPALALAQQFQRQRPEFIAVHDIGAQWSRRLLTGIAAASGRPVAQLDIRQEGSGAILARLEYVECPTNDGSSLRLYTTDITPPAGVEPAAAAASREQIALTLLAYARLGVAIVGDMSITAMRTAMAPLSEAMQQGPWPSRQLLLLPLTSAGALASLGSEFSEDTGVTVRSTPQVSRIGDAWSFISGTWNRLREELMRRELGYGGQSIKLPALPGARRSTVGPGGAPAGSVAERPAVALPVETPAHEQDPHTTRHTSAPPAPAKASAVDLEAARRYIERIGQLPGLVACTAIFWPLPSSEAEALGDAHYVAQRASMSLSAPGRAALEQEGRALLAQMERTSDALNAGTPLTDAMLSTHRGHLLLRRIPHQDGLMLVALYAHAERPMLYDLQLRRIDAEFEPSQAAG